MIEKMLCMLEKAKKNYRAYRDGKLTYEIVPAIKAIDQCKEIVQEVAKEYDWVPVSERLPEPFQRVLVYDAWDDSMTIEYLQEDDSFIPTVVAWMPLPAPYQKGE